MSANPHVELEPCPVCGGEPKWRGTRSDYVRGLFRLQCLGETHLVQSYGPTEAEAITAWNTRATLAPSTPVATSTADARAGAGEDRISPSSPRMAQSMLPVASGEVDNGMNGAAVERAELLWSNLPTGRSWASLQTHEKALVCHSIQRLTPTPDDVGKIECTSTHCERRQECASPSECTGNAAGKASAVLQKPGHYMKYEDMLDYEERILAAEMLAVKLTRLLRPFADKATKWEANHPGQNHTDSRQIVHRFGDFRAARDAIERGDWRDTPSDQGWRDIAEAPAACHVLACRFDRDAGEWVIAVVLSPPTKPFTHWRMLPDFPADPRSPAEPEEGR